MNKKDLDNLYKKTKEYEKYVYDREFIGNKVIDFINKHINLVLIISFILMGIGILFFTIKAEASAIYIENFNYSTGNLTTWDTTGIYYQVSDTNCFDDKCLYLGLDSNGWGNYQYKEVSDPTTDISYLSAWLRTGQLTTGGIMIIPINTSDTAIREIKLYNSRIAVGDAITLLYPYSVNTWYEVQVEYRKSDNYLRARYKVYGGSWNSWTDWSYAGGSVDLKQLNLYQPAITNVGYIDNIIIGEGNAPDEDETIVLPVNNLFFVEPFGETTSDFRNWTLGIYTDQIYSSTTGVVFSINYGTTTNFGFLDSHRYHYSPPQYATTGAQIFKTQPLENGTTYYFQGSFSTSSDNIIATTTINSITIDGSAGESYYDPTTPESTTTASSFIECENFGWPINWLCDGMVYLFYPSTASLNSLTGLWDSIKLKAPIGYLSVGIEALNLLTTESTSTLELPLYAIDETNDITRPGLAILLLILEVFYFVNRIRKLEI